MVKIILKGNVKFNRFHEGTRILNFCMRTLSDALHLHCAFYLVKFIAFINVFIMSFVETIIVDLVKISLLF